MCILISLLSVQAVRVNDINAIDGINDTCKELNEPDDYGYTPLMYAAKYGHLGMVKKLLDKSASMHV